MTNLILRVCGDLLGSGEFVSCRFPYLFLIVKDQQTVLCGGYFIHFYRLCFSEVSRSFFNLFILDVWITLLGLRYFSAPQHYESLNGSFVSDLKFEIRVETKKFGGKF